MKRLCLFTLIVILLAISGCSMENPEDLMEFPLEHQDRHVEPSMPSLRRWCAGLCPDWEALR